MATPVDAVNEVETGGVDPRLLTAPDPLKVHKIENFFGSDFEFCVMSLLVMLKY